MLLPRYYTVEEANSLIPLLAEAFARIDGLLGSAGRGRTQLESAVGAASAAEGPAISLYSVSLTLSALSGQEVENLVGIEIAQLNHLGVFVRSLLPGVVDVLARRGGEQAHLCWRVGEAEFGHWHPAGEGFDGRLPIDDPALFGQSLPS